MASFETGLFGPDFGGGGGGPSYGKSGKKQINLNLLWPLLMQASYANVAMGNDPIAFLESFKLDKKAGKSAKKAGDTGVIHIGKSWYDVGALSAALPGLLEQAETAKLGQLGKTFDKLSQIPEFKGIFDEASGNFSSQFTSDVNAGYESLGNALLGTGAKSGFLSDENKQAQILGPLALQKAEFLKNIQKAAEAQKFGLAGVGGIAGGPANQLGVGSPSSFMPGIFQTAGMNLQANMFSDQLGFNKWATKLNLGADLAGSFAGMI